MIQAQREEGNSRQQTVTELCPAQRRGFDHLFRVLPLGNVFVLSCKKGLGRTTVLRELHAQMGGAFLKMKDFFEGLRVEHPSSLEETFERLVLDALADHST